MYGMNGRCEKKLDNKYQPNRYAVGEHIEVAEGSLVREYEIILVIPKDGYNMYLCKNKLGFKITITDKDYYIKTRTYDNGMKKIIKKKG